MNKDNIGYPAAASGPMQNGRPQGLGTAKDLATKVADVGPSKWALQRFSASLLPGWSVNDCMHTPIDGVGFISGIHVPSTGSGVLAGVKRCKSVWVCPVCASQITEKRRLELREGLSTWREDFQGRVLMLTYTFRHHDRMSLTWMVSRLNEAFRAMKKTGTYGRLLKRFGVAGSVAAREVKHSMKNGWHPHIHELLFVPADVDAVQLGYEVRELWEAAAAAVGLTMNEHGFELDDCDEHVVEYVTKFNSEWTEAEELSKWHLKRSRASVTRQADEHYTPFQLLRFAYEGDVEAGALFVEYAEAFYRKAQLRWKPGFREYLGLNQEQTDEECMETEQHGQVMVQLSVETEWPVIVGNDAVGELVRLLADGDMLKLCEFLELFGIFRDVGTVPIEIEMRKRKKRAA